MSTTPYPAGLAIAIDAATEQVDESTLIGGSPQRMMRLSDRGRAAWQELRSGASRSLAAGVLARRLTDAGLAHPRPADTAPLDVTFVIPVHGRVDLLGRCLESLPDGVPVIVVDDASPDPDAIAAVAAEYGAELVRRESNGGPAAARNTALASVTSGIVAFLDSDCIAPAGWIAALAGHFHDPLVAAVAPRIVVAGDDESYPARVSLLDLGARPGRVQPGSRISYVPTAAMLVRVEALRAVGFDESLRYGEDVDFVWRLDAAGWRVRYDPTVSVIHNEAAGWRERLAKRYRYGTSAAPLHRRHPGSVPPLVVSPWPAAVVAAMLMRRPALAAIATGGAIVASGRALREAGLPASRAPRLAARGIGLSWLGVSRAAAQFGLPLAAAAFRRRRVMLVTLLGAAPVATWAGRSEQDPRVPVVRFVAGQLLDDAAYGAGVIAGCIHRRTAGPLTPRLTRK